MNHYESKCVSVCGRSHMLSHVCVYFLMRASCASYVFFLCFNDLCVLLQCVPHV